MIDIVCLGEALIDMFPAEIGRSLVEVTAFRPVPGGAPANVAVAAARLGAHSAFIGKVGDDPFGHYLAELLHHQGVETRGMRFDSEARTGINFHAQIDENHATHLFYRHPSADMRLRPDELERTLLREARAFVFGTICLMDQPVHDATMEAIDIAREVGALIAFDVNYRESLWSEPAAARELVLSLLPLVDVLKINEAELSLLTGSSELAAGTQQLVQHGPTLCVVTLGPQGCFYRHGEQSGHVPGFAVQAIDATGCGDAFTASLLTQLVTGSEAWRARLTPTNLPHMLRRANAAGALTALKQGAFSAMPDTAAISALLEQYDHHPQTNQN
ncbi:MAG TPA: PfkB family carbohydrate kinase [Ktedonobacteraceae bacterium]|nr:PfkB family carbohydrate kinase [Ktedonobacteraceae bacterium]